MLHAQGMDADLSPDITEHTSNLELIYITAGSDHKELAERLKAMQHMDRQERLGSAADGSIALSRTFVAPTFTAEKKSRCDIKFVRWLVRKNRPLSMSKKSLGCQFHGSPASGGGYTTAGKQHDALKNRTVDKTLEISLTAGIIAIPNYRLVMTKEPSP
jgi:hypothetical protein